MTHRNLIVVDLDSTLYDFIRAFAHVADRDHGVKCHLQPEEWSALLADFADPAVAIKAFPRAYGHDMLDFNTPYEGAQAGVQSLKDLNFRVAYYTDRPQESRPDTEEWLAHYEFPQGELHVCTDKRGEIFERRDEVATIVDDRPRTLVWSRYELGLDHAFSLRHGYNRNLADIPGVHLHDDWGTMVPDIASKLGTP